MRRFLSGNEAVAQGVRLSKPNVISAYPITPQTTVVEKLSEIVEQNSSMQDLFMLKVNTLLYLVRLAQAPSEQELSQRQVHKDCCTWQNVFPTQLAANFLS